MWVLGNPPVHSLNWEWLFPSKRSPHQHPCVRNENRVPPSAPLTSVSFLSNKLYFWIHGSQKLGYVAEAQYCRKPAQIKPRAAQESWGIRRIRTLSPSVVQWRGETRIRENRLHFLAPPSQGPGAPLTWMCVCLFYITCVEGTKESISCRYGGVNLIGRWWRRRWALESVSTFSAVGVWLNSESGWEITLQLTGASARGSLRTSSLWIHSLMSYYGFDSGSCNTLASIWVDWSQKRAPSTEGYIILLKFLKCNLSSDYIASKIIHGARWPLFPLSRFGSMSHYVPTVPLGAEL